MSNDYEDRPTLEETYAVASRTSNLRVQAERHSPADIIIAAGLSSSVVGMALIRLHGEWSAVEKPRAPTPEAMKRLADSLTFDQVMKLRIDLSLSSVGNLKPGYAVAEKAAKAQAWAWYRAEVEMLLGKLKSFREVHSYLTEHLKNWDERPEPELRRLTIQVLIWWLDQRCKVCDGTMYKTAGGVKRPCNDCRSTGKADIPCFGQGRRIANYIDDSCQNARSSLAKLRGRVKQLKAAAESRDEELPGSVARTQRSVIMPAKNRALC